MWGGSAPPSVVLPEPPSAERWHVIREDVAMPGAVGFDLDMTLVDTRRGIHAALLALAAETGRGIDADAVVAALGPPVAEALSPWFGPEELDDAVERFRLHMARVGVQDVTAFPGAADAVRAAHERGFRTLAVTSKIEHLAIATLEHAGLAVDEVHGGVWAADKAAPLVAAGAVTYVGDHPADMVAAGRAGIPGVGVVTGSSTVRELYDDGARVVLSSLLGFRGLLDAGFGPAVIVKVADRLPTEVEARTVASWRYPPPYDTYDVTGDDAWRTLLTREPDGEGYYPIVATGVVGYVCFGAEARVVGQTVEPGTCDVGMGIRPDLLSARIGSRALRQAMDLGRRLFQPTGFRAAVAAFNDRSLQLCRSAGFVAVREFVGPEERPFVELVRATS
jgi:phosphoglycolate phosphatase